MDTNNGDRMTQEEIEQSLVLIKDYMKKQNDINNINMKSIVDFSEILLEFNKRIFILSVSVCATFMSWVAFLVYFFG